MSDYSHYLKSLPVMPEVAAKILGMAENNLDISFKELEEIIMVDPGLTAKILKIANSALYARQREIKSLQMAITLLGFKNIKSLVLLVTASNAFAKYKKTVFYQYFWKHSILSAFFAKHITLRCGRKELAEETFLGALLHNIGQVAFFNADQEKYQSLIDQSQAGHPLLLVQEQSHFGVDHRALGGSILKDWNFPDMYVDIALEHYSENITSRYKLAIVIVSAASLFVEMGQLQTQTEQNQKMLDKLFPHIGLAESDKDFYMIRYMEDLKKDDVFLECQSLFGLKS